jgi:hypothetical protein
MEWWGSLKIRSKAARSAATIFYALFVLALILADCRSAAALPAFARKYGMPCSACHLAWPMLSAFGQQFKDNGYQMGNDRDAPIFQQAAYWPVTFRITPIWHRESTNHAAVDAPDGSGGTTTGQARVTTHGFDWSGLDFHTGGTLAKNFSFYVLPSSDNTGAFHFESVWARMDNVLGSSWLNFKMGKFELDNLLSEKRILTLTGISGVYTNYHFQPVTEGGANGNFYTFGIGDNQDGFEWMGHSKNDRTRVSASLISQNEGTPGLPTSRGYGGYFAASQAFEAGSLGMQRVGAFAFVGEEPTYFQSTSGGAGIPGTAIGNKPIQRYGLIGQWYIKKFDITTIFFHSSDNAYLATGTAANTTLPIGARSASWNGGLFESHYMFNPQLILINRYELVRMSQQALPGIAGNLGNTDVLTFGMRYYPFISSRAGFAYHTEYSIIRQRGVAPVPSSGPDVTSNSLLFGFDFAF